jgi:hypothetical protein
LRRGGGGMGQLLGAVPPDSKISSWCGHICSRQIGDVDTFFQDSRKMWSPKMSRNCSCFQAIRSLGCLTTNPQNVNGMSFCDCWALCDGIEATNQDRTSVRAESCPFCDSVSYRIHGRERGKHCAVGANLRGQYDDIVDFRMWEDPVHQDA